MIETDKQSLTIVRVYTDDSGCDLDNILDVLSKKQAIVGLTVFRGIAGFGPTHKIRKATFIELSANLPIVIEFFHETKGIEKIINNLHEHIKEAHIVNWKVNLSF
jgi:PII-like signaling protein